MGYLHAGSGTVSTLEILGRSHDGDSLWFRVDGEDCDVTVPELANWRNTVAAQGWVTVAAIGDYLAESQVTTLINAMNAPQFLWPPVPCRGCGVDASVMIEGDPYCEGHARFIREGQ